MNLSLTEPPVPGAPESGSRHINHRYGTLVVLVLFYILNFIDRQLVAVLSPVIKLDLNLSDTQLGLLKGFAFVLIYSIMGLPIARLADRKSRVNIVTASLVLWSSMTLACGMATNFSQFILARIGFGVGAAGCSPAAHSLIAGYFPREERSKALAIYTLGIPLGLMTAFILGSWFTVNLGWRTTFVLFGISGLILSLLRFTLTEPKRDYLEAQGDNDETRSFMESIGLLMNEPTFRLICVAACAGAFCVSGLAAWIMDFFVRGSSIDYSQASLFVGLAYGIFGSVGMLTGAMVADRLGRTDTAAYLKIPGAALLLCAPLLAAAIWMVQSAVTLILITLAIFLMFSFQGPAFALAQSIAPRHLSSIAAALLLFFMNLGGSGMGPLVIGVISDLSLPLTNEDVALRLGMSILCPGAIAAGSVFLISARKLNPLSVRK